MSYSGENDLNITISIGEKVFVELPCTTSDYDKEEAFNALVILYQEYDFSKPVYFRCINELKCKIKELEQFRGLYKIGGSHDDK